MTLFAALLAASPFLPGGEPGPVLPVPGDDETVVTARKRAETLSDVPLSVTALDARELEDFGVREVSELVSRVPNVLFSEFSARRLSFPFVRGVGSGINEPAVLTYVDDVPQFGFGGVNLPLFALERVEFLRGPQGTLYGKNALGGLIHLHGRRPSDERLLDLVATRGSDNLEEYSASYSGSLAGGLAGDIALLTSERDGFTTNDSTGNDVDDRDGVFGRGRLLWNPSANTELDFTLFGERSRDGGFVLSELTALRANPHHINQDFEGLANRDVFDPALVFRARGDELDFTSVSSWQLWEVLEFSDFDFSPIDGVRRHAEEEQEYLYQEFRLGTAAHEGANEPGKRWLVGASGFLSDAERQASNTFRPGGAGIFFPPGSEGTDRNDGQFDDQGLAVFGELTVPLGEVFELGAGLRYDREEKEVARRHTFDPGGGPIPLGQSQDSETFDELVPMASASWRVDDETRVFARAAKGWKAGGFNLTAPVGSEQFDSETAWSYELGWRQSFDAERYTLGATLFLIDWEDMQLAQFDFAAGGFVDNAGEAESRGLELEGQAELAEGLEGFATVGLLSTEIQEFTDSFGTDTSGNELPFAPENTWSLGLRTDGELPSGALWTFAGDYARAGDFFYDAGNRAGDDFGIANFRLGIDSPSYGVAVWLRNAFDEEYETVAFQPSPVDPTTFVGESGAPRVLGFTLSIHL
ncbi:MAG: TonB-dependent receptor [Planctomycetes bacterium]|nr:TonB-dependent receptor [Planctomycetota bacterium]